MTCLSILGDGAGILSGSRDKRVRAWDIEGNYHGTSYLDSNVYNLLIRIIGTLRQVQTDDSWSLPIDTKSIHNNLLKTASNILNAIKLSPLTIPPIEEPDSLPSPYLFSPTKREGREGRKGPLYDSPKVQVPNTRPSSPYIVKSPISLPTTPFFTPSTPTVPSSPLFLSPEVLSLPQTSPANRPKTPTYNITNPPFSSPPTRPKTLSTPNSNNTLSSYKLPSSPSRPHSPYTSPSSPSSRPHSPSKPAFSKHPTSPLTRTVISTSPNNNSTNNNLTKVPSLTRLTNKQQQAALRLSAALEKLEDF